MVRDSKIQLSAYLTEYIVGCPIASDGVAVISLMLLNGAYIVQCERLTTRIAVLTEYIEGAGEIGHLFFQPTEVPQDRAGVEECRSSPALVADHAADVQ